MNKNDNKYSRYHLIRERKRSMGYVILEMLDDAPLLFEHKPDQIANGNYTYQIAVINYW